MLLHKNNAPEYWQNKLTSKAIKKRDEEKLLVGSIRNKQNSLWASEIV